MGATSFTYATPLRRVSRHLVSRSGTVTLSSSYATGGDDFAPIVGKEVLPIVLEPLAGRSFEFDRTTNKLKAFAPAGTEETAAGNLSTVTTRWSSLGKK